MSGLRPKSGIVTRPVFPFSAIAGQDELKLALLAVAVDPGIGGVLAIGDRGTGKSTAIRALAALLPAISVVPNCPYACDPAAPSGSCPVCQGRSAGTRGATVPIPVVDLPLGATEDRVVGALNLERALADGRRVFEPGLLAKANRGFLYIDEVNLLEDHLVDLLLDVAASGENLVERDGLSLRHPAKFVLVGTGNPEEGELRPQLLDRFGLAVDVRTPTDVAARVEIVRRRDRFEQDPAAFIAMWKREDSRIRRQIVAARERLAAVSVPDDMVERATRLALELGVDGLRGELTLVRAARAAAALDGVGTVTDQQLRRMAPPAMRHRLRRGPLDEGGSAARIDRAMAAVFDQ